MAEVNQFIHSFVDHDAVSSHARHLRRIIDGLGIGGAVYAGEWRGERSKAKPFRDFDTKAPGAWSIYHLATASPIAEFVQDRPESLAVDYHNITPYELLAPWEPVVAPELQIAREQMAALNAKCELAIGASRFNEKELVAQNYENTTVAPVLFDPAEFDRQQDVRVVAQLAKAKSVGGVDWLFVGRITPHKCQHQIVQAFHVYKRLYDRQARLYLVGGISSHLYWTVLKRYIETLGLSDAVVLAGSVSNAALSAYYRNADVFVCLSEHEGFGVPVLEAMADDVPVVAFDAGAVGEVVGNGGVLLVDKAPGLVAAAVDRVTGDSAVKSALVAAGHGRIEAYSFARAEQAWVQVIEKMVAN